MSLASPQILVQAVDSGVPALSDLSTVTITVNRNLNPPVFVQNVYNVTILETRPLGETFVSVRATDDDLIVSWVSLFLNVFKMIHLK